MSKDPAFLFFPNDFVGGTLGMSYEQKGAYLDLLIMQFNVGRFTIEQAEHMLSICFCKIWPIVSCKFKTDGTYYWNERLELEVEKRRKYTESRRNNASIKNKYLTNDKEHMQQHMQQHMGDHMENRNRNRNIIIKKGVVGGNSNGTKKQLREFVKMTEDQHKKLIEKYGEGDTEKMIDTLDNYKGSKGKVYKDDYRAILSWVVDKVIGVKQDLSKVAEFNHE